MIRLRWTAIPVLFVLAMLAIYDVCHTSGGALDTIVGMSRRFSYGVLYALGFWTASFLLRKWMIQSEKYSIPVRVAETQSSGPGTFKVSGVDHDTKFATTEFVYAESPSNAQVKVELKGVDVAAVERA